MKKQARPLAKDVDEYLASLPEEARTALEWVRRAIKAAAPGSTERISYGMPMTYYHGMLVGFAAFKDHLSFFPGPAAIERYAKDLKKFDTSRGTIRFHTDKPLPSALIRKLVKARIEQNDARLKARAKR